MDTQHISDVEQNDSINIRINDPMETVKKVKPLYYASNIVGGKIMDAITGYPSEWLVGSYDEMRFFKVIDSRSETDENGRKRPGLRVSHQLFYESPSEYMKHRGTSVDPKIIEDWHNRKELLFPDNMRADKSVFSNYINHKKQLSVIDSE